MYRALGLWGFHYGVGTFNSFDLRLCKTKEGALMIRIGFWAYYTATIIRKHMSDKSAASPGKRTSNKKRWLGFAGFVSKLRAYRIGVIDAHSRTKPGKVCRGNARNLLRRGLGLRCRGLGRQG